MCYGIRALQPEPRREGAAAPPSTGLERLRPRLAGALAALAVAGFATAAFLAPLPPPGLEPVVHAKAAPASVAAQVALPPTGAIEQISTGVDDGIPTALNDSRQRGSDCHHGL